MIDPDNYQGPGNHFLHHVMQTGMKSVTSLNGPPSDVHRSDCNLKP